MKLSIFSIQSCGAGPKKVSSYQGSASERAGEEERRGYLEKANSEKDAKRESREAVSSLSNTQKEVSH